MGDGKVREQKHPVGMERHRAFHIGGSRREQSRIYGIAFSPDGERIATGSSYSSVYVWRVETGELEFTFKGHRSAVFDVCFSPDGKKLASGSRDKNVFVWDLETGQRQLFYEAHQDRITSVAWSPEGHAIVSGSDDGSIGVFNILNGKFVNHSCYSETIYDVSFSPNGDRIATSSRNPKILVAAFPRSRKESFLKGPWSKEALQSRHLEGHRGYVSAVAWSPNGRTLASCSDDLSVRIWDVKARATIAELIGHTRAVHCVDYSHDGRLLASKSSDGTTRLWCTKTFETVALLQQGYQRRALGGLAFHPTESLLAARGAVESSIDLWKLDYSLLLDKKAPRPARQYRNAKVVLVGDTGVGKSGLALRLTGKPFSATESTHGRQVLLLGSEEVRSESDNSETRETLLWDLAGQPGYRLIHQLHLNQVAVALIVFDSRNEVDPFAGVRHWVRALRQAESRHRVDSGGIMKILVAARADRGGSSVSRARIDELMAELNLDAYFETSSKEGWEIDALAKTTQESIRWEALTQVRSDALFERIIDFLKNERATDQLLVTRSEMFSRLREKHTDLEQDFEGEQLADLFDACVVALQNRDLLRSLGFGDLILLKPEILDAYASAIVDAARAEPQGLGTITEAAALAGEFRMSSDERLADRGQEELVLYATVEELLRHELAFRENGDEGPSLVFPSQFTRERPDLPDPPGKAVAYTFEGPLQSIYSTLAVRLTHTFFFELKEL